MNLLTIRAASEQLAISPSLLYRLVAEGRIKCFRIGRSALRFSQDQIDEYLSSCEVYPREPEQRMPRLPRLKHIEL